MDNLSSPQQSPRVKPLPSPKRLRPSLPLPTYTADAFSLLSDHVSPPRPQHIRTAPGPPPRVIKTDTTKCLIRALRSKPESAPLNSAALKTSLSPSVAALQAAQRASQRAALKTASRAAVARRRQITTANGRIVPTTVAGSTSVGRSARACDRMTFGTGLGMGKRPRDGGWAACGAAVRRACMLVGFEASMRNGGASERLVKARKGAGEDVQAAVRAEMAKGVKNWNAVELREYSEGAEMDVGEKCSKRRLAALVMAHLMPDMAPQQAKTGNGGGSG